MNDEDEIKKNEMKKQNKDLIEDDEMEEEEKKENINEENKIENGLNDSKDDATNISEKGENNKHKEKVVLNKYIPKNEQEALKAKIINLELKEKPNHELDYNYNFRFHENIETNIKANRKNKFIIPKKLKKTFIIVMILAILGITLIICGFIKAISDATPGGGIMFWVLGSVVMIPGGFYSYQFYKAKKAKQEYIRQDILDNIPQL